MRQSLQRLDKQAGRHENARPLEALSAWVLGAGSD
jgi:hypothetical protein